jgi:enoyl-CoA hydratase/carnithine racemase
MSQAIVVDREQQICTIRINRADKKNAITGAMYAEMADALEQAERDQSIRVVLLTGSSGIFSSGNDIIDFLQNPPSDGDAPVARYMRALASFPKPVVAAVAGPAVGIGTTLLLHCDLVYADSTAVFQLPFVNIGICPEFASSYLIPRMMGHVRAAELLLLADRFDAAKAREYGLINAVTVDGEAETQARRAALALAAKPPSALRISKALLKQWSTPRTAEAIEVEAGYFMPMLKKPEAVEAFSAFAQKRAPDFSRFD